MNLAELADSLLGPPTVILEDRVCPVPDRPLPEWLAAIVTPGFDTIVPALLAPDDAAWAYDRLLADDDPLDPDLCEDAGLWVLEQLTGRPWWEVQRGVVIAVAGFNALDGWARTEAGVDVLTLPLRSLVNLVVRWQLAVRDPDQQEMWLTTFAAEPAVSAAEMESRPEWQDDAVGADALAGLAAWQQLQAAAAALPD